jgi:hypothetical protein
MKLIRRDSIPQKVRVSRAELLEADREKRYRPMLRLLELERKALGLDMIKMNKPTVPIAGNRHAFYALQEKSEPNIYKSLQGHKSEHHRITSARRLENRLRKR